MSCLLLSRDHKQQFYWSCKINVSLVSIGREVYYVCKFIVVKWKKLKINFSMFSQTKSTLEISPLVQVSLPYIIQTTISSIWLCISRWNMCRGLANCSKMYGLCLVLIWIYYASWGSQETDPHQCSTVTEYDTEVSLSKHFNDVIMSAMASQITSLTIVYSSVFSGADQRNF